MTWFSRSVRNTVRRPSIVPPYTTQRPSAEIDGVFASSAGETRTSAVPLAPTGDPDGAGNSKATTSTSTVATRTRNGRRASGRTSCSGSCRMIQSPEKWFSGVVTRVEPRCVEKYNQPSRPIVNRLWIFPGE